MPFLQYLPSGSLVPKFKRENREQKFWDNYAADQQRDRISAMLQSGVNYEPSPLADAYQAYQMGVDPGTFSEAPPMTPFETAIGERQKLNRYDVPEDRIAAQAASVKDMMQQYLPGKKKPEGIATALLGNIKTALGQ